MALSKWSAPVLFLVAIVVIGFGLYQTASKNLEVAPWTPGAEVGRLHAHMKNVTRMPGDAARVREAVLAAVFPGRNIPADLFRPADWREAILAHVPPVEQPRHVVVLPGEGDEAKPWSLPGAFWAVYAGSPVVFAGRETVDDGVLDRLAELAVPAYVLAPPAQVSDDVVAQIAKIVPTRRVAGPDLADHAVTIATFRDPATGFGWGRTAEENDGYFHYVMASPSEADQALAALPLAWSNAATFLFLSDRGGIPDATDRYLWTKRTDWFVTPAEGPFHHLWMVGNQPSYGAQGRADLAVEKADYAGRGKVALGGLEGLAIVFIAFGIAGALFVFIHGRRLLPDVMPATRIGWVGCALLLPVLGVVLYLAAYRRPVLNPGAGMPKWVRPPAIQAAAATAVAFGYGAPVMIAIGFLFLWFGFPLLFGPPFFGSGSDGWDFLLGSGMPLMMLGMYVGAILLAWPIVQLPMRRMTAGRGEKHVALTALGVTVLSMSAVSLGMMAVGWFMIMQKLPMMPTEDEILWYGSLWLASTVGFLIAWPLNWPMVRRNLKPGAM